MAKVGIITYHHVSNYGAVLQAWSLLRFIESLGHEAFLVDYRPAHLTTGGGFWFPSNLWRCKANLVIVYMKLMALKQTLKGDVKNFAKFSEFQTACMNISAQRYTKFSELRKHPPEADAFICGSDQIWNASKQNGVDPAYFLSWVPFGVKKIAYAPSFGRQEIDQKFRTLTAKLIEGLDEISVREQSAVGLVRTLTGRDAKLMPDPTLLISDDIGGYSQAVAPQKNDYIFSYTLRSRNLVSSVENFVAQKLDLPIVSPVTLAKEGVGASGPLEWLGHIQNANFVITNSFHGTLFSIIFNKPFLFTGLTGSKSEFNERAKSILELLELNDRMVFRYEPDVISSLVNSTTDWSRVNLAIKCWRSEATDFLTRALS